MSPVAIALSLLLAPAARQPASTVESHLKTVYEVARKQTEELDAAPPCAPTDPAAGERDLATARAHARTAELYAVVALRYPAAGATHRIAWIEDFAARAVDHYQKAFACQPRPEHRHHLAAAAEFLGDLTRHLSDEYELPPDHDALVHLRAEREQLLRTHAAQKPEPNPTAPVDTAPGVLSYLSLQLRLGGGAAAVWDDRHRLDHAAAHLGLAFGVRFLAGKRRRHSLGVGLAFDTTLGELTAPDTNSFGGIQKAGLYLRYGLHIVPTWFSLHVEGAPALVGFTRFSRFADLSLGGAALLCTWSEAICVRGEGYWGRETFSGESYSTARGYNVGLTLDPLRIVENARARREPGAPRRTGSPR